MTCMIQKRENKMIDKETLLGYTASMAANEPADRDDVDHATNVRLYNLWMAQNRRAFSHMADRDITPTYWKDLVEEQIELLEVRNGADLDLMYGWPNTEENRAKFIESREQAVDYLATRVIETSKEY